MGRAISKTVTVAEIIKRRVPGLHQITELSSVEIVDVYRPLEEGLDVVHNARSVSCIKITLSKEPLDTRHPGYQAPLPEDEVVVESPPAPRTSVRGRGRGGRRGRGRGRRKCFLASPSAFVMRFLLTHMCMCMAWRDVALRMAQATPTAALRQARTARPRRRPASRLQLVTPPSLASDAEDAAVAGAVVAAGAVAAEADVAVEVQVGESATTLLLRPRPLLKPFGSLGRGPVHPHRGAHRPHIHARACINEHACAQKPVNRRVRA
jgi:hypothetical protein